MAKSALAQIQSRVQQHADLLVWEPYVAEDGTPTGGDLGAEVALPRAPELLCQLAFSLAREHGLVVFDPQLGRQVTEGDEELIKFQIARGDSFLQSIPVSPSYGDGGGLLPSTKLWLVIGGSIVGLLFLSRALSCFI